MVWPDMIEQHDLPAQVRIDKNGCINTGKTARNAHFLNLQDFVCRHKLPI